LETASPGYAFRRNTHSEAREWRSSIGPKLASSETSQWACLGERRSRAALNGSFPPKADIAAGQDSRNAANPRTNGGVDRSVVGSGLTAVVLTKISQYIRALLIPALAVVLPHDFAELRR
jgi:hypothetical protein